MLITARKIFGFVMKDLFVRGVREYKLPTISTNVYEYTVVRVIFLTINSYRRLRRLRQSSHLTCNQAPERQAVSITANSFPQNHAPRSMTLPRFVLSHCCVRGCLHDNRSIAACTQPKETSVDLKWLSRDVCEILKSVTYGR